VRYIDTGSRNPEHTLGFWLQLQLSSEVDQLRWQSGFFGIDGTGLLADTLERLRASDLLVHGVVGANAMTTLAPDVALLAERIGIPRKGGRLGVVSYSRGLYHPKVYHMKRKDDSQCAYVGSANLTYPGVSGLNIEAGILLDTREGDSVNALSGIRDSVDAWFLDARAGFYRIDGVESVDRLLADGILSATRVVVRSPAEPAEEILEEDSVDDVERASPARLRALITLPRIPKAVGERAPGPPEVFASTTRPAVPRSEFPPYLLFDPSAKTPTSGAGALSGASLPSGAVGLVIRLNRDSARHFDDRAGTANLSVPVATLGTLRFGIFKGRYERPRAEYTLRMRYVSEHGQLSVDNVSTNIMAYGFAKGETGHGDVRMVLPAAIRVLSDKIARAGWDVPKENDFALLEWPNAQTPSFRLSFLDPGSGVFATASQLFGQAAASNQLVGEGTCWLSAGIASPWS
jgi:hypothetical protein